jgi:Skp family chaperone for outer membrane proteins
MAEEKVLELVRNLLARAEHPNTPAPEADLCFKQADKLMFKHAIDDAFIRASQSEKERQTPVQKEFRMTSEGTMEFWPEMRTVLGEVAYANRCRAVVSHYAGGQITLVGFKDDVEWTEMLFTSIYFSFVRQINPKWDNNTSYDANVYNFKVAGYKWKDINEISKRNGGPDHEKYEQDWWTGNLTKPTGKIGGAMIGAYKRHAKLIGDNNIVSTQSHDAYRRQFTSAFCSHINRRLRDLADERERDLDTIPGAALALVDSRKVVDEEFFRLFPQFRPASEEEIAARAEAIRRQRQAEIDAREAKLAAMTDAQRYAFLEEEQAAERRAAQRDLGYWRKNSERYDSSAHERGRSAAASVDLNKPGSPVNRPAQRKELG